MFFQPQYLQDVRGHTPIVCGLLVLPITGPDPAVAGKPHPTNSTTTPTTAASASKERVI